MKNSLHSIPCDYSNSMMESNSEMKTSTTMRAQSTPPRKEIFNDSFFIRKSIINDAVNDTKKGIHQMNTDTDNTSSSFIPDNLVVIKKQKLSV
jgi:hypothetical protein